MNRYSLPYKSLSLLLFALCLALPNPAAQSQAQSLDAVTGLKQEPGWEIVKETCTRCHTAQIITSNSGNRAVWESRIRWMQAGQGLGELSVDVEETILDYLSSNYGQKASSRRPLLTADLLPPNPFAAPSERP